ncbi:MAG: immunoglobulin-like domain-containing protein [Clostridia bacterium]
MLNIKNWKRWVIALGILMPLIFLQLVAVRIEGDSRDIQSSESEWMESSSVVESSSLEPVSEEDELLEDSGEDSELEETSEVEESEEESSQESSSAPAEPVQKKNPYIIKVNKKMNCVTIYGLDEKDEYTIPVKAMVCSTGSATPLGTFKTSDRYRWKILDGDVWGQYSTRITGHILFHSVPYKEKDNTTLKWNYYNKLGSTASAGCVRLTTIDAKWILDNCPKGTTVIIYNDSNPGPLGKPSALKLPSGTGWDPTDPDPANPWKLKEASLKGVSDRTIEYGGSVDVMSGVKGLDKCGNDITDSVEVSGLVDANTLGTYSVTYTVTDITGSTATAQATFTVQDTVYPVITMNRVFIEELEEFNEDMALKMAEASDKSGIKSFTAAVEAQSPWSYVVLYTATDKNGLTQTLQQTIERDHYGELTGVEDRTVTSEAQVTEVSHIQGSDKGQQAAVEAVIENCEGNRYTVRYEVVGTKAAQTAVITLEEESKPEPEESQGEGVEPSDSTEETGA